MKSEKLKVEEDAGMARGLAFLRLPFFIFHFSFCLFHSLLKNAGAYAAV
jgi:hypothetical protein